MVINYRPNIFSIPPKFPNLFRAMRTKKDPQRLFVYSYYTMFHNKALYLSH